MAQQNVYDNEVFFERFKNVRSGEINFNDCIETPILHAGFLIEKCEESHISDEIREKYPAQFGGTLHQPNFVFFRCRKHVE